MSRDPDHKMPTTEDLERAERLHEVIEALCEVNKRFPVVVEGKKDMQALRKLGLSGDIIPLHNGRGIYDFSEELAERFSKVVLLLDWDTKGETLFTSLKENLHGHWEAYPPGVAGSRCVSMRRQQRALHQNNAPSDPG